MDVLLWRCVLGLLCTPAVLTWTVSQSPSAVSLMKVNSSAEILCSTSLPDPTGLYLMGRFHDNRDVLYLSIADRAVERDPEKGCGGGQTIMELILIVLSWTAFIVILFLLIGALVWRCTRTKKHYTPARDNRRHHHHHHQHVCPQHRPTADPQFIHPSSSPDHVDFKGIL
ncbi:uncharacterized protein ACWYII_025809 isoform 2-T2 [Salvelinus alpinus]|uniref:uncharacterized protein isoform X2 n=1 Tax=Salvelinus sp. IW2-2015 TaxID=2691554 RepID=UPI0038D47EED